MTGVVVLIVALAVAAVAAVLLSAFNGRFRSRSGSDVLTEADLGTTLGERATLLHFSSAFCAPCRATRTVLADAADRVDGVALVEVDAESHVELVRRLDVMRTPTVFVLDSSGAIVRRASGAPRREQVLAALAAA